MYKKKILSNIRNYCIANYRLINQSDMVLGDILYNYECHLNAIQKIKEGKASKVFACIAIDKNDSNSIVIHFINQLENGKYIDHTWGWLYEFHSYYIIKEINSNEFNTISIILNSIRNTFIDSNSNWLLRKLFRIKSNII
jgi:hypothetical protein